MKVKSRQLWVEKGYQLISNIGFKGINIEMIGRNIQKSKSSFYHYFGDWEGYEEALMDHHLILARKFAIAVNNCENIIPDLVDIFIDHKEDILFHKQLRINRDKPHFRKCFVSVFGLFEDAILDQWITFLRLQDHTVLASRFLTLLSENFLLQITPENFTHEWIKKYLEDVSNLLWDINLKDKN